MNVAVVHPTSLDVWTAARHDVTEFNEIPNTYLFNSTLVFGPSLGWNEALSCTLVKVNFV